MKVVRGAKKNNSNCTNRRIRLSEMCQIHRLGGQNGLKRRPLKIKEIIGKRGSSDLPKVGCGIGLQEEICLGVEPREMVKLI